MTLGLALALGLALPARAQQAAVPFVPNFLSAVSASFAGQPFYGSMLLNAFEFHLKQVGAMTEPKAAAYLKAEILGGAATPKDARTFAASLRRGPLGEHRAAALLLANAAARPDQFREVLDGLENIRPGLGRAVQGRLAAGGEASGALAAKLRRLGSTFKPHGDGAIYDRHGELQTLFDGSAGYPAY
ncbi:MAG: hypothetical protein HY553_10605 [Elusimicrobia bacterium]|nr:hypothetical protein [Elusimicrobiota bacterium]